jgi:biopolymer transport protein ExbD
MRVHVGANGGFYHDGGPIDAAALQVHSRRFVQEHGDTSAVVVTDRRAQAGRLVAAMDALRAGGIESITVATRRPRD